MVYVLLVEAVLLWVATLAVLSRTDTDLRPKATEPPGSAVAFSWPRSLAYSLLIILAIVGVVYVFATWGGRDTVRLIWLNRWAVLLSAVLVGLVPLSLYAAPALLRGLLVVRGPAQLFNAAWLSVLAAFAVLLTTTVAEANAPARYFLPATEAGPGWGADVLGWDVRRLAVLFLLAVPVPYACLRVTAKDRAAGAHGRWAALVGGLLFGYGLLLAGSAAQAVLLPRAVCIAGAVPCDAWFADRLPHHPLYAGTEPWLTGLLDLLGPGYTTGGVWLLHDELDVYYWQPDGSPVGGHAQVAFFLLVGLAFYFGHYLVMKYGYRRAPDGSSWYPAVFFLLLALLLFGVTLQGLAFWLDFVSIPVSVGVVVFTMLMYWANRTDHFFDLAPPRPKPPPSTPPTEAREPAPVKTAARSAVAAEPSRRARADAPEQPRPERVTLPDVAATWRLPRRTLVCVTAAGGGIQAAAWAARVLIGLHRRYGPEFTASLRLLSAVSGGSVGAMFYLDAWRECLRDDRSAPLPPAVFDPVLGRAAASSLEAAAWGIAYPDLMRVFFPPFVARYDDRGARVEESWANRLTVPESRLADWGELIAAGKMPAVVFNATIVETGQRMLLSPILSGRDRRGSAEEARELLDLYPHSDLRVSTAARLSATFPYVSPICRPTETGAPPRDCYHFCDGGYVDNEGLVTVIDWLGLLLAAPVRPFDRVLIVRVQPIPLATQPEPARARAGWLYSTLGPLQALQQVRVASQIERNDLAVGLLATAARAGVEVRHTTLQFKGDDLVPVSWMLSDKEKENIDTGWESLVTQGEALEVVDRWFPVVS